MSLPQLDAVSVLDKRIRSRYTSVEFYGEQERIKYVIKEGFGGGDMEATYVCPIMGLLFPSHKPPIKMPA